MEVKNGKPAQPQKSVTTGVQAASGSDHLSLTATLVQAMSHAASVSNPAPIRDMINTVLTGAGLAESVLGIVNSFWINLPADINTFDAYCTAFIAQMQGELGALPKTTLDLLATDLQDKVSPLLTIVDQLAIAVSDTPANPAAPLTDQQKKCRMIILAVICVVIALVGIIRGFMQ